MDKYSGRCVYPGGIFKINLSGDADHRVAVSSEHVSTEYYDSIIEGVEKLKPGTAGMFPSSKLNYVKIPYISGPYFKLGFKIYDGRGNLISSIDSGSICNLSWFRSKYGNVERYYQEKEPPQIEETVLSAKTEKKGNNVRAAVFCLICFTVGGFMGFRTPKMLEY